MAASTMGLFMDYFERFEHALQTGVWDGVAESLAANATYAIEGVPFGGEINGRDAIVCAFQKSTSAFDATMDFRLLEIISMQRLGPDRIRVDLISGYGRDAVGSVTAPVTIEVTADDHGIVALKDSYDEQLTAPALTWLATHCPDADPSYT